jgi:hypothetical protein
MVFKVSSSPWGKVCVVLFVSCQPQNLCSGFIP